MTSCTESTPLFADPDLPVQVNAARAVEQISTDSAALLLKLRAELASGAPELLGACYAGVLRLEGPAALPWAVRFLNPKHPDEASIEAAFAIADLRTEAAARALIATHKQTRDRDFRDTLFTALALTRHDVAIDFLFTQIADGNPTARAALEASAPTPRSPRPSPRPEVSLTILSKHLQSKSDLLTSKRKVATPRVKGRFEEQEKSIALLL